MFYNDLQGKLALYVHWPFCLKKCPYCDFNVHLNNREEDAVWIDAYLSAFKSYAETMPGRELASIFFGGGTPSLMPPVLVEKLIEAAHGYFRVSEDLEVTLEANPTSSEMQKFQDFRSAGVNRVSIGLQSLREDALQFLGRQHSAADGLKAVEMARSIFDRYSFDLIYARPGQSLAAWETELLEALDYADGHLSLYELTIEENTPFYKRRAKGDFEMPDEVRASDFFLNTFAIMRDHGLPPYEISNYGAAGQECRYNVMTWLYEDYIGIGPGAHGRVTVDGHKYASYENRVPAKWLERVREQGSGHSEYECLNADDKFEEALITGLRMTGGVPIFNIEEKSGLKFEDHVNRDFFQRAKAEGWMDDGDRQLRLTPEGLLRYDAITRALLSG